MNWFKGEISEGIVKSKQKESIFVVYIEGKDEKSSQITALVNGEQVGNLLGGDRFVAIKIEADSVLHQQFSQIYSNVPVPSLYFIGKQGVPIQIVTEVKDAPSFLDTLNNIVRKGGYVSLAEQTQNLIDSEQAESPPPNVVCENNVCSVGTAEASTSKTEEQPSAIVPEPSVEDKVERAKQLVEKKRLEKQREEDEKERQNEIERRKLGQNVQQMKRWQDDQELKNILEEREREKRESQKARERVLAQIAQDRAERAAKFSPPAPPQPQSSSAQPSPKPSNSNTARLQFRMPDGKVSTQDFASNEPLENVHAHIRANLNLPFSNYTLSTTFPRREFTDADKSQSLLDLGLVPTAVVLILPLTRGGVVAASGGSGGVSGFLWLLLTPLFSVLGYLKAFIFGDRGGGQNDGAKRQAEATTEPGAPSKVRKTGEATVIRRQGNVHRLSNRNDSDDENNTWNGNSTQQM